MRYSVVVLLHEEATFQKRNIARGFGRPESQYGIVAAKLLNKQKKKKMII